MADEVQRDLGRIEARLDAGDERMGRIEAKLDALAEKIDKISGHVNRVRGAWGLLLAAAGAIGAVVAKGIAMLKGGGS